MSSALVISLDFELGWGVLDSELWRRRESQGLYRNLRPALSELFQHLKEWECPTTWASVGSMFEKDPSQLELDHLPTGYRDAVVDFVRDAEPTTRDARDLMDRWSDLEEFSEIASHTSTHIYPTAQGVEAGHYATDFAFSCAQLEAYFGSAIQSLVFTRDDTRFLPEVMKARPVHARVGPSTYRPGSKSKAARMLRGAARFIEAIPPSEYHELADGGSTQSGSLYFNWSGGDFESLKRIQVQLQAKRALRQLARGDQVIHVWLHPFNLAESPRHLSAFLGFLSSAVKLRDAGKTEILTMRGFARRKGAISHMNADENSVDL